MSRYLVTGGSGFVGRHVVALAREEGHGVVSFDTRVPSVQEEGAEYVIGDIMDQHALAAACVGVDAIIHLAARVSVPESVAMPKEYFATNAMGTVHVLEAARANGVRRVALASSAAVYGDQDISTMHEGLVPRPKSPYAESKVMGERLATLWYELYGIETVSLRCFNIYGSGMSSEGAYASAVGIFLARRARGESITITGDGDQTRDYVHVSDVARAYLLAATVPTVGRGEVFNIASGTEVTLNAVAREIGGPIEYIAPRPGDILRSSADIARARESLGFTPQVGLHDGIAQLKKEYNLV